MVDFCKLAIDFLQNGPNEKLYKTAADKLSIDFDSVQNCIYGLVNLLLLSCKHRLDESDFRDSVLTLGFSSEQQNILYRFYESKKREIFEIISKLKVNEPHYHDLNWRFEVQVASRALLEQVTPLITLDLTLKTMRNNSNDTDHLHLQTDITNLVHITQELENALFESRSKHSRKIQRSLNSLSLSNVK